MKYSCLIVEDEILIRKSIAKKVMQVSNRFKIIGETSNGAEALKFTNENYVNLIITDIQMPIMDGLTLCEKVYLQYPDTKILILSGYNDFNYAQKAIRYKVCDYLLKPIDMEVLTETLNGIATALDQTHVQEKGFVTEDAANSLEQAVYAIQNYLNLNYKEEITINQLAKHFNFTPTYLGKIFKNITDFTPLQYIIYLRINEAKRLILSFPELSLSEIGKRVGYDDPYYFSRIFKKQTGMNPSSYGKSS